MSSQNPNPCCKCTDPQYYLTLNAQGPQGRQGQNGVDGFSPTIEVVNNDYSNYQLRVTNATSSFTTPNLKANLPSGGNTGQILTKNSDTNGDYVWSNISSEQLPNNILLNNKPLQILNKASIITDQSLNSYIAAIDGIEDESGYCNGAILTPNGLTLANFSSDGILIAEQGFGLTTKNIQAGENIFFSYTEDNPQKLVINGTAAPYTLPQATADVLGGIKVGDGLSITDDGVLSASGGGSELNHIQDTKLGVQIDDGDPIPQTGTYYYKNIELRSVSSASISGPSAQIYANINTYQDGTLEQRNNTTIINVSSGQFLIGNDDTQLRLYSSDEIQANVGLGVTKVVTTGLRYKTLTSTEYEALSTKDADTMYRLTDTNQVYLGTIELTGGGANIAAAMFAEISPGGRNTGHVGTNTVSTYDPPTT